MDGPQEAVRLGRGSGRQHGSLKARVACWMQPPRPALRAGSRSSGVQACRGRLAERQHLEPNTCGLAGGAAASQDGVPTPPFPKQVPPFRTPPVRLPSSRKRPMQSLSWLIKAGIGLAAPRDKLAASRAQKGLPESADLAGLPLPARTVVPAGHLALPLSLPFSPAPPSGPNITSCPDPASL